MAQENCDQEYAFYIDEDIEVEHDGSEIDHERAQIAEYHTQYFLNRSVVQHMIRTEMEKLTSNRNTPVLAGLVKDMLIEAL